MSVCLYQEKSLSTSILSEGHVTPHHIHIPADSQEFGPLWTHPEEGITKGGGSMMGTNSAAYRDLRWHLCHHLSSLKGEGEETACREGDCVCIGDIESETVQGYSAGGRGKFKWKKSGEGKAFMPVCVKICQLHRLQAFPYAWQEKSCVTVLKRELVRIMIWYEVMGQDSSGFPCRGSACCVYTSLIGINGVKKQCKVK